MNKLELINAQKNEGMISKKEAATIEVLPWQVFFETL